MPAFRPRVARALCSDNLYMTFLVRWLRVTSCHFMSLCNTLHAQCFHRSTSQCCILRASGRLDCIDQRSLDQCHKEVTISGAAFPCDPAGPFLASLPSQGSGTGQSGPRLSPYQGCGQCLHLSSSLERRYGPWFCFGRPLLPFVLCVLVSVHYSQTDVSDWSGVLVAAVLALALKLTQGDRLGRHLVFLLYAAALASIRTCGRIYSPGCWKACCPLLGGQRVLGLQAAPHCKNSLSKALERTTIWTGRAEFGQKAWRDEG